MRPAAAPAGAAGGAAVRGAGCGRHGVYFQICVPVTASTAYTPFGALKYITLSTTIGAPANRADPVLYVHARSRFATFAVLIWFSVEKRVAP